MDEHAHAQGMAHCCSQPFAQLIVQVPTHHCGDNNLQIQLIGSIAHISGMSQIGQLLRSAAMMYRVAELLLSSARADSFGFQDTASRLTIGLIADANAIAQRNAQFGERAFAVVDSLISKGLPATKVGYAEFQQHAFAVREEITVLGFYT